MIDKAAPAAGLAHLRAMEGRQFFTKLQPQKTRCYLRAALLELLYNSRVEEKNRLEAAKLLVDMLGIQKPDKRPVSKKRMKEQEDEYQWDDKEREANLMEIKAMMDEYTAMKFRLSEIDPDYFGTSARTANPGQASPDAMS